MTKEKALIKALKIVEVCKEYGSHDRCLECPFNIGGCIVTNGDNIPEEWRVNSIITNIIELYEEASK